MFWAIVSNFRLFMNEWMVILSLLKQIAECSHVFFSVAISVAPITLTYCCGEAI